MSASANTPANNHAGYCNIGDHVHELGTEDGKLVPICTPFQADPGSEPHVPMPDVASGFSTIVHWICSAKELNMVAARALTLQTWLDPVGAQFRSLNQIAEHCAVTRAALSKAVLVFRDEHNIGLTIGRLESSRAVFRQAQRIAFQNGTHSSQTRKNRKPQFNEGNDMTASEIRQKFRTLDAAVTEIERLQKTQSSTATQSPTTAAATPKPVATPRPAQKPPASSRVTSPSPPKLSDLNQQELVQVLDVANARGDRELVARVYGELNERRKPL
jgi:hypothetical protein